MGLFDYKNATWEYYVCSVIIDKDGTIVLTNHICNILDIVEKATIQNIKKGMKFKDTESATEWIDDYKSKWDSGENSGSKSKRRDKKIEDVLNTQGKK